MRLLLSLVVAMVFGLGTQVSFAALSCEIEVNGKTKKLKNEEGDDGCAKINLEKFEGWEQGSWASTCDNETITIQYQLGNPSDMNVAQATGKKSASLMVPSNKNEMRVRFASCKIVK